MKRKPVVWTIAGLAGGLSAAFGLVGCAVARPFSGPGYTKHQGVTLDGAGTNVVVGVTNAQVDGAARGVFDEFTRRTIESLASNDGFIGYSVRSRPLGNEVWTMTVWRDSPALDSFVQSPAHRAAMREGLAPVVRAKFLRFEVPAAEVPPTWESVLDRLKRVEYVYYGDRPGRREPR
jgi:heme-degrading monooxygenase HmoA